MNAESMLETYRQNIIRLNNRLSLTALPEQDSTLNNLPLDKVFVKLKVVAPTSSVSFPPRFSPFEEERPWREYDRRLREKNAPPPPPISIATALKKYRHLMILGAPGAGKTTLLRWLAVTFAQQQQAQPDRLGTEWSQDRLPILLELRRFAGCAKKWCDSAAVFDLAKEIGQWIHEDACFPGVTAKWITQYLTQQPCLILLDGLDELTDLEARRRFLESLEALSRHPQYEKVQCILTSRFHGFQGLALGPFFQQTEIHPFDDNDTAQFIRHWYATAYPDLTEQAEEAQKLIEAIKDHEGVKALAQNPLLCTITAIIYRHYRLLPRRRVELYAACCQTLLDTWERNKAIKDSGLIGQFDWQTKLELLMPVAYAFHHQGQLALPEEEVVRRLAQSLKELRNRSGLSADKPLEQEAREFIIAIRDRSGLLQGRGDGTLAFIHRTFQEYLTARYLAQQEEAVCIDEVMTHLHQEWWQEVHLLVVGHLGSGGDTAEKATHLLLTVLHEAFPPPSRWLLPSQLKWERWFDLGKSWRATQLLAKLLWWSNLSTWFPRLQWSRRLAWFTLREFEWVAQAYTDCTPAGKTSALSSALSDFALQRIQWLDDREFLCDILNKYALPREAVANFFVKELSHRREWVRRNAAKSLGQLGQANEAVLNALIQVLQDKEVRMTAAESLGQLAQANEAVLNALIQVLQDKEVRMTAAESLGQLAQANEAVLKVLIQILQDKDEEEYVRRSVVRSLGRFGQDNEIVLKVLIQTLQNKDEEKRVRWSAVFSLERLGQTNEMALNALAQTLRDDEEEMRSSVAFFLGSLDQTNEAVLNALIQALQDKEESVCLNAARSLYSLGRTNEAVLNALIQALLDKNAARGLYHLGQANEAVLNALIQALQDKNEWVRWSAVWSLGRLGQTNEAVFNALIQALQDKSECVQLQAVESLGELGQASEAVLNALIQALQDKERRVHLNAAKSLVQLGKANEAVLNALIQALQDKEEYVRSSVAESLGQLGQASEAVLNALIQALQDKEEGVRENAAKSLGQLGQASEAAVNALIQALRDKEGNVRPSAVESLGKLKIEDEAQRTKVLIILQQRLYYHKNEKVFEALRESLKGKQIPGYRWRSLVKRRERREKWKERGIWVGLIILFLWALQLGFQWYPELTGVVGGMVSIGVFHKFVLEWRKDKGEKSK